MASETHGVGMSDGIGARLKAARERAGLSLIVTAEKLHVDPQAVEALEAERFDEFGASVYVRGHLRHYAELVGESPAELQELYAASGHVVRTPDLTRVPSAGRTDPSEARLVPGLAVVVSVALIGSAWWVAGGLHGTSKPQSLDDVATLQAAPSPPVAAGSTEQARGSVPAGLKGRRVAAAVPGASPGSPARAVPAVSGAPRSVPGAPDQKGGGPAATAADHPSAAGRARVSALQLHFSEDSWAEVYDAHGTRLLFDVGSADSTRTVSGTPPLRVVLGNPVGVSLQIDGRPVSAPAGATRNVSIEFRINRSGRVGPSSRLAAADERSVAKKSARD